MTTLKKLFGTLHLEFPVSVLFSRSFSCDFLDQQPYLGKAASHLPCFPCQDAPSFVILQLDCNRNFCFTPKSQAQIKKTENETKQKVN